MAFSDVKNALYTALQATVPNLVYYPESLYGKPEKYPNLSFVDLSTRNLQSRFWHETHAVANPVPGGAPLLIYPVVALMDTDARMHLRDTIAGDASAAVGLQRMRAMRDKMEIFFAKTQSLQVVQGSVTTACEIWLQGFRSDYDQATGIYLQDFEVAFRSWRLVDDVPIPAYRADEITLDVDMVATPYPTLDDGSAVNVSVTREYPLP